MKRILVFFLSFVIILPGCVEEKKMIKTRYVPQSDEAIDCGFAGITMLVNHFYPEISYAEIVYSLSLPWIFAYFPQTPFAQTTFFLGDKDYEFLGELYGLGYRNSYHTENVSDEQYDKYLNDIKKYIDRGIPVMVGGWDLYYDDFWGPKIREMGLKPGQSGHNIVVIGYDRDYIYYLDPGAVVGERDPVGNVTYRQSYENFRNAVTSLPWKLYYTVYEKVSDSLAKEERITLVEQRNKEKFYGKKEVFDSSFEEAVEYSKFGFDAFDSLKEDLKPENFTKINSELKEELKENFLASVLGPTSLRYHIYSLAWATEWGSKYLEERESNDSEKMEEISRNLRNADKLFIKIFQEFDGNGMTKETKRDLESLREVVGNIEDLYKGLIEKDEISIL